MQNLKVKTPKQSKDSKQQPNDSKLPKNHFLGSFENLTQTWTNLSENLNQNT